MLQDDPKIKNLMYESAIEKYSKLNNVTLSESKIAIASMSFMQYLNLLEAGANIAPPSGQTIGSTGTTSPTSTTQGSSIAPSKKQIMWNGPGAPIEQGMTVGLKGPNGLPVPGEITQVDQSAKGVRVRNPTTGQEEWHGNDDLQPFTGGSTVPGATNQAAGVQQQMAEDKDLARMKHLAGIKEDASCGATGAGGIAVAPTPMGKVKKRQAVEESPPKEYTPKKPAETIVGDTKPGQASGELSANLAVRGKKTASRINNGFKR
jgi:hypothetical protein